MNYNICTERDHEKPYVIVNRQVFEDERLSWEARGIMGYLLTHPHNNLIDDLVQKSPDGRNTVYNALKELEKYGYLVCFPENDDPSRDCSF